MSVKHRTALRNGSLRNQIETSCYLILTVAVVHVLIPPAKRFTRLFYQLPYYEAPGQYLQGADDIFFVLGWLVLLTAVRGLIIAGFQKIATRHRHMSGKACVRFSEQGWLFVYYGLSFSVGLYILVSSSYWLNFNELWSEWPTRLIAGHLKWYYLVQFAFCLQQLLAVNIEQRRKDFTQMFSHHVVTCMMMYITYTYRWTKMGHVVLCIMDVVDFLLPLAKMLKYLHYELACNIAFGVFLATWLVARHMIFVSLLWSIYRDVPGVMDYGCYSGATGVLEDPDTLGIWRYLEPFFDQNSTICLDRKIKWAFLGGLLVLQVLSLVWFVMIIKVAYGILKSGAAKDTRSGDENEEDEEDKEEWEEPCSHSPPSGSTSVRIQVATRDAGLIQSGFFGGRVRIPGSRDRKEVLGRVGCNS